MDGIGAGGGIGAKDLYNKVRGNQAEFVKQWQAEYKGNPFMAEKIYNYVASMDTDGTPGLTPEEYKQGLSDKKALAEIKLDKIHSQYVPEDAREDFAKMGQEEKLAYLESKIPHEPGREAEAHIMASLILSSINRLDTEIGLLDKELGNVLMEENYQKMIEAQEQEMRKAREEMEKPNQDENIKNSFNGLG